MPQSFEDNDIRQYTSAWNIFSKEGYFDRLEDQIFGPIRSSLEASMKVLNKSDKREPREQTSRVNSVFLEQKRLQEQQRDAQEQEEQSQGKYQIDRFAQKRMEDRFNHRLSSE